MEVIFPSSDLVADPQQCCGRDGFLSVNSVHDMGRAAFGVTLRRSTAVLLLVVVAVVSSAYFWRVVLERSV